MRQAELCITTRNRQRTVLPLPERGPSARSAGGLHRQGWARPIFSEASLLHVNP